MQETRNSNKINNSIGKEGNKTILIGTDLSIITAYLHKVFYKHNVKRQIWRRDLKESSDVSLECFFQA